MEVAFIKPLMNDYVKSHIHLAMKRARKVPEKDNLTTIKKIVNRSVKLDVAPEELDELIQEVHYEVTNPTASTIIE